jgi:hypothetical protein
MIGVDIKHYISNIKLKYFISNFESDFRLWDFIIDNWNRKGLTDQFSIIIDHRPITSSSVNFNQHINSDLRGFTRQTSSFLTFNSNAQKTPTIKPTLTSLVQVQITTLSVIFLDFLQGSCGFRIGKSSDISSTLGKINFIVNKF